MPRRSSIFISYSWDSSSHKKWVLRLARRLEAEGLRVWLDQTALRPGQSLTQFMEAKIRSSGHVIVVCTPQYATRSNRRIGGVGYEQQIISTRIAAGIPRHKFIPIVRSGNFGLGRSAAMPEHLAGCYAIDMRDGRLSKKKIDELASAISTIRRKAAVKQHKRKLIRLATIKDDGWNLGSGVELNKNHPKTFWIPSAKERESIEVGDIVKLIFDITDRDGTRGGERMWVDVAAKFDDFTLGTLANSPLTDNKNLFYGAPVVFKSNHVIDIVRRSDKLKIYRRQRATEKRRRTLKPA